jgi:hypothetical protein
MKRNKISRRLISICLFSIWLASGCQSCPTRVNTARAVYAYFDLKGAPYSIIFGHGRTFGNIRAWPIEVYPLEYRDHFERKYPGEYMVFRNEACEWKIARKEEMKDIAARRER